MRMELLQKLVLRSLSNQDIEHSHCNAPARTTAHPDPGSTA